MMRRMMLAPLLAALLAAGQGVAAAAYYGQEVRYERSNLDEIRNVLEGRAEPSGSPFARPGLLSDGRPFRAQFTDLALSRYDGPRLAAIVEEITTLPPDSRVEIQGRMDGEPFRVTIHSDPDGRKEARLEGLVLRDRYEAMNLLDGLMRRGVEHARLDGRIGYQHIVGRLDNGYTRIEG